MLVAARRRLRCTSSVRTRFCKFVIFHRYGHLLCDVFLFLARFRGSNLRVLSFHVAVSVPRVPNLSSMPSRGDIMSWGMGRRPGFDVVVLVRFRSGRRPF